MDKSALQQEILKIIQAELEQSAGNYKTSLGDSMVDRSEPVEIDEQSQAGQAAEIAEALGVDTRNAGDKLAYVSNIDFGSKSEVSEGAVVSVGGRNYVIAVATNAFKSGGKSYVGISSLSPLYKAMDGLEAGESFTLNGKKQKIDSVA